MTVLRTTRRATDRRSTALRVALHLSVLLGPALVVAWMAGCNKSTSNDPEAVAEFEAIPYRGATGALPPPAMDQIRYKPETRTLSFYELPRAGRWKVLVAGADYPSHAGPDHRLPEGVDPKTTYVYYERPGGQISTSVSLSQIQAAGREHESQ